MTLRRILDAADELACLRPEERAEHYLSLPEPVALAAFMQLAAGHQEELIDQLDDEAATELVEALDPDDRVRLFEQMPEAIAARFRSSLSRYERRLTDRLLKYPAESAGRIMTPEFISLPAEMGKADALEAVRAQGSDADTILMMAVTDEAGVLLGTLSLSDLVMAPESARIEDLMDAAPPSVHVEEDQEIVARLIQAANVVALPVVDGDNRVLGLVTVDDAMDVAQFEQSEDLARAGAAEPLGRPYFSVSLWRLLRSRVVWLMLLGLAAVLTVNVLSAFEHVLEEVVSLSLFIPLLIGVGGNTGAQSATTIVRAIATGEARSSDIFRILARETSVGFLLGTALGLLALPLVSLVFSRDLAWAVSLSLVAICTLAALVGSMMPMLARRVGIDPAVVSAPFVTTIVDASGLLTYLLIASAILDI